MRCWVKSGLMQFILAIAVIAGVAPSLAEELTLGVAPGLGETEMRAELDQPILEGPATYRTVIIKRFDSGIQSSAGATYEGAGRQVIARSRKKLTGYAPANDGLYGMVRRTEKSRGR